MWFYAFFKLKNTEIGILLSDMIIKPELLNMEGNLDKIHEIYNPKSFTLSIKLALYKYGN